MALREAGTGVVTEGVVRTGPLSPLEFPDFGPSLADMVIRPTIDARVLVVSADGTEEVLPAIRQVLDYLGTPYTVWVARSRPGALTTALSAGTHGYFQGVILATGGLTYNDRGTWRGALTDAEWRALWDYEASFGVRQATFYTFPTADYGFQNPIALDTTATPLAVSLTVAGRGVFGYLNPDAPLTIRLSYAYLARPLVGVVPLITDAAGNALAAVRTYADGRENLALTFDGNPYLTHTVALSYGVLHWVTRGFFLGERHVYAGAHIDDIFIDNDRPGGGTVRINHRDLTAVADWQRVTQRRPLTANVVLDMAYNALGTDPTEYPGDTLVTTARALQGEFRWINHTYSHENLDATSYGVARVELSRNIASAATLGLSRFSPANLVTPDVSGLNNAAAMRAAADLGVRYVVSDTSQPGGDNPTPNAGRSNASVPTILQIPRRPNNLFYFVSTPTEWVSAYNGLYRAFWGRDLSYAEVLEQESGALLGYLLRGEIDPWMFHQPNLVAYDGARTTLTDLLDRTFARYGALYTLPILSLAMDDLGRRVADRMAYNAAGVTASFIPRESLTLRAARAITVPVTGLRSAGAETYGGQPITWVTVPAGGAVTVPLP